MPNKQLLQSAGDGTAVPTRAVGGVLIRSDAVEFTSQNGWKAGNGFTITDPGVYIFFGSATAPDSESTASLAIISTNNLSDGSGELTGIGAWAGQVGATPQTAKTTPLIYLPVNVTSSTTFYFKYFTETSITKTFFVNIFALRIA